jgi:hypothetical protein
MAALVATGVFLGCSVIAPVVAPWSPNNSSPPPAANGAPISPGEWVGKSVNDLKAKFGQPTSVLPLAQTAGYMIVYAEPGGAHYVFETGPNGKIVSATATH